MKRAISWIMHRPWLGAGLALLAVLAILETIVLMAEPRLDRKWADNLAVMPAIEVRPDGFTLGPATDWHYDSNGPVEKTFTTSSEKFADLKNVWFVVEPAPGLRPMAHTLVLFEFPDDRLIGLTVEARREEDEKYSAFWGTFNRFELAYIWSTPRDLLGRRAVMLQHDVYVFPLALSPEQRETFLRSVLASTQSVSTKARFYNTLTSNCTNELAKAAKLGWHYSWVLTGYSPERLFDLKLIPGASIAEARKTALLTGKIKSWNDLSTHDFDRALLAELRRTTGPATGSP